MSILIDMIYDALPPVPAARTRSTKHGHHFTPQKYAHYKAKLAEAIRNEYPHLVLTVPTVGDKNRSKYLKENRFGLLALIYREADRGDTDNYVKSIQDALEQSGIMANDSQIDWGFQAKFIDKNNPRIEFILCQTPKLKIGFIYTVWNALKTSVASIANFVGVF